MFTDIKLEHDISSAERRQRRRLNRMDLFTVTWLMEAIEGLYKRWDSDVAASLLSGATASVFTETCKRSVSSTIYS